MEIKQLTLDGIRQEARDQNNNDLYIAIIHLCDYVEKLELLINNKPKVVKPKKEITKKEKQNG